MGIQKLVAEELAARGAGISGYDANSVAEINKTQDQINAFTERMDRLRKVLTVCDAAKMVLDECGGVDAGSRIRQAEFRCTSCGHVANADLNAAKNILKRGLSHET